MTTPKPKRGYRIVQRGKVRKGDWVLAISTFQFWCEAHSLIGRNVRELLASDWFVCRKIKV